MATMAAKQNDIKGKLALITGASGGIGAACARKLLMSECDLALTYSSNQLAVEELVAQLRKECEAERPGGDFRRISVHKVDVSSADDILSMVADVRKEHGKPIDILFSNAGYGKRIVDIWDIPIEEYDKMQNINSRASFILIKAVVDDMKAQKWGRIVLSSSIAAYGGGINGCHYAASKGALTAMMKNLSSKLAPFGITVNDIAPAMIGNTGMVNAENIPDWLLEKIPVGRLGYPDECANMVDTIVKTGYMTGQSILLTGGMDHK
ncbi:3-ketoacyl-acyl carrier protein reductase [Pseudovirgaria hyperparasitica]|uniref:3-ketoacyl-acyl carrier protein reductase n=1 Tax=Pseudovirgaria hyperparasitica TaxID=470096 RepID=A0A6A6WAI3_9PEZI|nr:3-ketoacyl-acyl carrier protein reductase [Pseudovirgaria hyperparasitica]KAF2759044.1 3-ketoacyl-acyl carrier protein reductase [Pseudovirgaria hyperparasitica]